MATTEADGETRGMTEAASGPVDLADVRRLEAVGLRAWPAASVHYDGAWQVRLTAGHPSRRLNSVNPLDPSDMAGAAARIAKAVKRFRDYGRTPTFRLTPLAPSSLDHVLRDEGWQAQGSTSVMTVDLGQLPLGDATDRLPIRDFGRYVDASLALNGRDTSLKPGMTELIRAITPPVGLFLLDDAEAGPIAAVLCVHDNDLAGIFELVVHRDHQGRGHARSLLASALRWARHGGAKRAWLQVDDDNAAAHALYAGLGFKTAYRYHYRALET